MSPNILTEMKSIEKYFILMTLNWGFYFKKTNMSFNLNYTLN